MNKRLATALASTAIIGGALGGATGIAYAASTQTLSGTGSLHLYCDKGETAAFHDTIATSYSVSVWPDGELRIQSNPYNTHAWHSLKLVCN